MQPGHRLVTYDIANRRATCSQCGPVSIKRRGNGQWRCAVAVSVYKRGVRENAKQKTRVEQQTLAEQWEERTRLVVTTPCCGCERTLPSLAPPSQPFTMWDELKWRGVVACACGTAWIVHREFGIGDDDDNLNDNYNDILWATHNRCYYDGEIDEDCSAAELRAEYEQASPGDPVVAPWDMRVVRV